MLNKKVNILIISLIIAVIAVPIVITGVLESAGIRVSAAPAPTPGDKPAYSSYKGVAIGMTMDEARAKLGSPKDKSDEQDSFVFSDNESAQVYYNATKMVNAVMITYSGKIDAAPTAKAVFGEDADAKPDGGIFKMVRYPKAGFWISYNKTAGKDPLIIVAIQKM